MRIEKSAVTKVVISEAPGVDPITVFLEDLGQRAYQYADKPSHISRQGKITIECYGESWAAYWGGMGDRTVSQFFSDCSVDYIAGCLVRGTALDSTVFSGDALKVGVRRVVMDCRRGREAWRWECGSLDKEDARRLFDAADYLGSFGTTEGLCHSRTAADLLCELFTEEWHHAVTNIAFVPNGKYTYLCRIIEAIQQALGQPAEAAAA